ncbi:MAG TPA: hypothetical protein VJ063_01185, partial [Verrucomicrobiae bacterium]|nr:hypothetical protein [Verrucomicrobiae bacterium]
EWKFVEYYDTGTAELYNLATDSNEMRNLASEQPGRTRAMARRLNAWLKSMDAQTNAPNPSFRPELFHKLYETVDVSRYVPSKANNETRASVLEWRRGMNAVLRQ